MVTEVDRFVSDLRASTEMQQEAKEVFDISALADFARSRGYDLTAQELRAYEVEKSELSEEELDAVAGGKFVFAGSVFGIS